VSQPDASLSFATVRSWLRHAPPRPRIVLTEANLRALRLGYVVVTSEATIELRKEAEGV